MKAWLKYAIILELIVILPSIIFFAFGIFLASNTMGKQAFTVLSVYYFPIAIISSFLIGSIIGIIVQKIKSKKQAK